MNDIILIDFGNDGVTVNAKLFKDGDVWCVLFGENIQTGIAGFDSSIRIAIEKFKSEFRNS
jgi:hypothetical protein